MQLCRGITLIYFQVLAISDVIIYRTRAERLPADFYTFLGQASKAYTQHFQVIINIYEKLIFDQITRVILIYFYQVVLKNAGHHAELGGPLSARGPAIIISHEPRHSSPLMMGKLFVFHQPNLATIKICNLQNFIQVQKAKLPKIRFCPG